MSGSASFSAHASFAEGLCLKEPAFEERTRIHLPNNKMGLPSPHGTTNFVVIFNNMHICNVPQWGKKRARVGA